MPDSQQIKEASWKDRFDVESNSIPGDEERCETETESEALSKTKELVNGQILELILTALEKLQVTAIALSDLLIQKDVIKETELRERITAECAKLQKNYIAVCKGELGD